MATAKASGPKFRVDLSDFIAKRPAMTLAYRRRVSFRGKLITINVRQRIAERTPYLTGRAAASWNAQVRSPDLTHFRPIPAGIPRSSAIASGKVNLGPGIVWPGKWWVSNSLDYIRGLNAGRSKKAPAGFVTVAVLEGTRKAAGSFTAKLGASDAVVLPS